MEKVIPFEEKLELALQEYGEGEAFSARDIPSRLLFDFVVKLFDNTKLAGDKGMQDEIIDKMFSILTVKDQYNLGIVDDTFLVDIWEENQELESLASIREQYNK